MIHTLDEMKKWLNVKLGREVTISEVSVSGKKMYFADYINHNAPAMKLLSDTKDGAITNLFNYLFVIETTRKVLAENIVGTTKG